MGLCKASHLRPPHASLGKSGGAVVLSQRHVPGVPRRPRWWQVERKLVLFRNMSTCEVCRIKWHLVVGLQVAINWICLPLHLPSPKNVGDETMVAPHRPVRCQKEFQNNVIILRASQCCAKWKWKVRSERFLDGLKNVFSYLVCKGQVVK